MPAGPASTSKAASMGRPSSIHLPFRNQGGNSDPPAQKVAFGRSTVADAEKQGRAAAVESQQRKLMRAGGAATGKLLMKVDAKAAVVARGRGLSPTRPSARDPPSGVQGFGKLQKFASKVNGPLIVSYDEEGREVEPANKRVYGSNAARSQELSGESEYLRIGGEEVDVISGDQLDRLLAQARRARSGR